MTIKNLKEYEFECNMSDRYNDHDSYDEWGSAYIWLDNIGVEYNFCIDNTTGEETNYSAIYKMIYDENSEYMETDVDTYIHYEIDFDNPNWKLDLENAMVNALIEFFNLK